MASRSAKKSMKEPKGKENVYNAQGAPEEHEAMDETAEFHKGGKTKKRAKRKDGGKAEGEMSKHRADKKPRGHHEGHMMHKRAAGGRTPYTSGHNPPEPSESGKTDSGHEGQRPSMA